MSKIALVGLTSTNTDKYVISKRCGRFQKVIINPSWTNVMQKRLAAEHYHKDWESYTIFRNNLVRVTDAIIKTFRAEKQFDKYEEERLKEIDNWMNEFQKVAAAIHERIQEQTAIIDKQIVELYNNNIYELYNSNRDVAIIAMKEAIKGYNVESYTKEPIFKRNIWIAPADSRYFDLQITKGECFQHPEERLKYVTIETDLDIIKNFVQVSYYNLLALEDAKLETELDRCIKATAEEIADINPDWIGKESFEENLVSLMDIKNRVGEEVYNRALEIAF